MPSSVSPACRPVTCAVPRMVDGVELWNLMSSVPLRTASIGTPRERTVKLRMSPENTVLIRVAAPVVRLIV